MRWLSSHKDAYPSTTKIQAVHLPSSTPEQNSRAATYIQFPSTSSSVSTDDMHGFSILGRFRKATPSSAHEQRVNSESRKPLRSILKPMPAPREPTPKPILAPRPRKASRSSPVENLEHIVSTRTPSRMHTPAQNPAIRPPGLRQDPSSGPQYQSQHQAFPMKPQEHVIPAEMMAHSRAAFPTKPKPPRSSKQEMGFSGHEEHYAQPMLAHLNLALKPPTSRPVTAIDTYQSDGQSFPEKSHHRSHRHKSESKEERKERKRREAEQAGSDPSKRHRHDSGRHRKDSGRHEDKHRDREPKRERSRSHREVMTDTEQWARQKPAPVGASYHIRHPFQSI
ncbi:hypothetical protein CYLTODRAFT_184652 [Cylindrobasidium torrendii FP15055 ss-10]|uniref:Uncharacterized protein n=1 Tax=Cylindrobasidium torrendii FP15055 ss-10 TaxID=1314674 RepID=A0A0D7BLG8_9AGAR|nr:hypothetical protein CYLTODRAFT_184652 [Cylindrobasidium torrendii FP15055 ss-10]